MYSFSSRVRYSEINENGKLDISSLVNYFQDCSTFQAEDMHIGLEFTKDIKCAWILCSWQIIVNRLPELGEEITIETWPNQLKGFYGIRNYRLLDEQNQVCAFANSVWVYLNMETMKPEMIPQSIVKAFSIQPPIEWDWGGRKLQLPKYSEERQTFPIISDYLDTNHHVNNGKYVWLAKQYVSVNMQFSQVRVEYRNEAKLGDVFYPRIAFVDDKTVVMFYNEVGILYAAVEFRSKPLVC